GVGINEATLQVEREEKLYMAWTGTDGRVNNWFSSDGLNFPDEGKVSPDTFSDEITGEPALGTNATHHVYLAWAGKEGDRRLNYESIGFEPGERFTTTETSIGSLALSSVNDETNLGPFSETFAAWVVKPGELKVKALKKIPGRQNPHAWWQG